MDRGLVVTTEAGRRLLRGLAYDPAIAERIAAIEREARTAALASAITAIEAIEETKPPMRNGRRARDGHSRGYAAGVNIGRWVAVLALRALIADANPPAEGSTG